MSLSKVSLGDIVKKQYLYKLKANVWVFNSLILLQLLAILFSLGGIAGSSGSGGDGFYLQVQYYSADMAIVFTMLWAFIISIQIISNKESEFMFIMNKASNHLSDALFLLTTSIIGGITATLSGFLLKVIRYIFLESSEIVTDLVSSPKNFMIGILATILFICLFSALGYIVGALVQLNKIFIFLVPILFIGLLFIANKYGEGNFMFSLFDFYFKESGFIIFMVKTIVTSALLFFGAFMISNRSEVKI